MHINQLIYPVALAIFVTASGCSSDSRDDDAPVTGSKLSFSAGTVKSRAVTVNIAEPGKSFAVWGEYVPIATPGQTPVNLFTATEVRYSGSVWSYDDIQYWYPGHNYSFAAIYPASVASSAVYNHGVGLAVDNYDVTADANREVDLMAASATRECLAGMSMDAVSLNFNHLLARINFVAKVNPSVTRGVIVKSAMVYGVPSTGSWDGMNWTASASTTTTEAAPLIAIKEPSSEVKGDNAAGVELFPDDSPMFVIPQGVPYDAVFKMTYYYSDTPGKENTYTYRLQVASTSLVNGWETGRSYRYTFEIGSEDFILFSKPEVVKWIDAGGSNIIIQGDQTN